MGVGILPLLIAVAAGLGSSGFDLFRKLLVRHLSPVPMVFLLASASVPLFGAAVLLSGGVGLAPGYAAPAAASVLLNVVANLTFVQAVRLSPLSVTVPLMSLTPVFTSLLGALLLGEHPAPPAVLGIALVVLGALGLNSEAAEDRRGVLSQPGAWLMAATALLLSLTIPLDKLAVQRASPAFHGLVLTAGIALGSLAVLTAQGRWHELAGLRRGWPSFLLALTSSMVALGLQLVALQYLLVGVIETLKRGIGNLMAVALGRLVFREALTVRKLGAAVVMAAGVALILLGGAAAR
jgi:drug/metabolite transporter (DMT)-like permease